MIRLKFSGFPSPLVPEQLRRLLSQRFELQEDNQRPDYVIYSVFSDEFLQYRDSVRIFFTGENVRPDFNLCDYAFGYDWMTFGDRYYRCPNYQLYDQFKDICQRRRSPSNLPSVDRRFCNFIYTNRNSHPYRDEFFHRLSAHLRVDSAGAHLRNCNDAIGQAYQGDWSAPKVAYQRGFHFSLAFENSSTVGYTTEKIVHALCADTIPIYWGNPEIGREFNLRRIINCHDFPSMDAAIEHIMRVYRDDSLYRQILSEPFFPGDRVPAELCDDAILAQFQRIFEQPLLRAFRRNFHVWGERYERQHREAIQSKQFLSGRGFAPWTARRLMSFVRRSRGDAGVGR